MRSKNDIMVSVCCITYNHEKYIRKTLESFLMQKTNFNYEIIIHDDASTDNTKKIIEEFEKKYPHIVKPIYEDVNQYSINRHSVMLKSFARVKGKYIALCEGDDYWCDENKLQMQYDYMEKNSNCTLCVHGTNVHNVKTNTMSKLEPFSKDYDLNIEYFLKNNPNFHTSSFFFPSYLVKQLPDFYEISPIGDLPFKMLFISSGYCHYINKIMSVYTWFTAGSWSERKSVESIIKKREYIDQMIEVYKSFNKYTNYKYQDLVDEQILKYNFRFYKETSNVKEIKKPEYYPLYKKLPLIDRLKISLKGIPIVFSIYNKFRK